MSVQQSMKEIQARIAAFRVGILLEQVQGGFFLFLAKDGCQLGYDFDEPWSAQDVIDYCKALEQALITGVM